VPLLGAIVMIAAGSRALPADSAGADRAARGLLAKQLAARLLPADAGSWVIHPSRSSSQWSAGPKTTQFTEIYSWIPAFGRALRAPAWTASRWWLIAMSAVLMAGGDPRLLERRRNQGGHSVKDLTSLADGWSSRP